MSGQGELRRVLRPMHLWGIAVGLVISGDYFGWNLALDRSGPIGMVVATLLVTVLFVCFIFSYTELSTAIPHSGGPFAYAQRALGPWGGYVAGFATLVEFVFAPPAIARAIGDYVHFRMPGVPREAVAVGACLAFGLLNALGVGVAALFELVVTAAATIELLIYCGLTAPHVETQRLLAEPLFPTGLSGIFAALPFAVWFYLGIEGVAMSAEEVVNPKRDIPRGYLAGIGTLVALSLGTLVCTAGILPASELVQDDKPLPKVLAHILAPDHPMTHLMVYLGLFGLVASLHGLIMGASRQVFALARARYLPNALAAVHPRLRTPVLATMIPTVIGAVVCLRPTDEIIVLSVLGALVLYAISMVSMLVLRSREPLLERPFRTPFHPLLPAVALALSLLSLAAVASSEPWLCGLFVAMALAGAGYFRFVTLAKLRAVEAVAPVGEAQISRG